MYFQEENTHKSIYPCENGTIYFGGGTPSILSLPEVKEILDCFPKGEKEITFECNPEDMDMPYTHGLLDLGINRISMGIQSLNNETLKAIHRSNNVDIFHALECIRDAILKNTSVSFNIDFILGLPYSKTGETLEAIKLLHKKYPFITHTSVYMLEDGIYPKDWNKHSIHEEEMEQEYGEICEYFDSLEWNHYEISNWSEPGYECQHNQGYWNHVNYRGFGLSATSFIESNRWENSPSFKGYYKGELQRKESLSIDDLELEKIIYGLRTFSLSGKGFKKETIIELVKDGLLEIKNRKILLTPAGIFRENFILSELIGEIGVKKI